jgi:hypothetical protein
MKKKIVFLEIFFFLKKYFVFEKKKKKIILGFFDFKEKIKNINNFSLEKKNFFNKWNL